MPFAAFSLVWPPAPAGPAIVPVFLPFAGCPARCLFCAQDVQTGQPPLPLPRILRQARQRLLDRQAQGRPPAELAFYGGTFTALPAPRRQLCLRFARQQLRQGRLAGLRCSTRPDCTSRECLRELRDFHCQTVELGIQSFADTALRISRRGYDRRTAVQGCRAVRQAGLRLGVQLMPGMPGSTVADFLEDVRLALDLGAELLRFYPCLVLDGTPLAGLWRQGAFRPWELDQTLDALAQGYLLAQAARVPVVRMGLAPEAGLEEHVLAGPCHPALGARVQALALLHAVDNALRQARRHGGLPASAALDVTLPRRLQGMYAGHGGELRPAWAALGVTRIGFHADRQRISIRPLTAPDEQPSPACEDVCVDLPVRGRHAARQPRSLP